MIFFSLPVFDLIYTEVRRKGGREVVDDAVEAFFESGGAEVDEEADGKIHQTQIGQKLLAMDGSLRGLAKIGVNLLAKYCARTSVNRQSFLDVIRMIRGEVELDSRVFRNNGFVWPSDFDAIRFGDGHAFRLLHDRGWWRVFSSFFGGRSSGLRGLPSSWA